MRRWIATTTVLTLLLGTVYGQGAELQLEGVTLPNNSLVDSGSISETTPLVCVAPCCEAVVWTLPNGTTAMDYQINNTSLSVSNGTLPSGVYRCTVGNQSVYAGIYSINASTNNGSLSIDSLSYNATTRTLTCISSGGPVTTVQWLQGENSLNQPDQFTFIADRETGRYRHTLRLIGQGSGVYSCVVGNTQGDTAQTLQLCVEGSLRLQGDFYDAVLQTCTLDVWQNVVLINPLPSGEGEGQFPVTLEPTDSAITVHWNISGNAYEVACSNGAVSTLSVLGEQENQVTLSASPDMRYNCCVSILCNKSGRIYTRTEHAQSCSSVRTEPAPLAIAQLSSLEIALIVLGVVLLLLLLLVALCGCMCSLSTRRKKNEYEIQLKDQSQHYTKQRIKLMTRPTSDSALALQDVGSVLFNRNAQQEAELQETLTFVPATLRRDTNMENSVNTSKDEPQPVTGRPISTEEASNPMYGVFSRAENISTEDISTEEVANNPAYGVILHEDKPVPSSTEEEASNPVYGVISHEDKPVPSSTEEEASNPAYGVVSHEDDNPLYVSARR